MQAIEVKGLRTNHRGLIVVGAGLLVIVVAWITTMQLDGTDRDNDIGATIAGDQPAIHTLDRSDWLAQNRAAALSPVDTSNAAGDRADHILGLRGERQAAMTDRADTIQQLGVSANPQMTLQTDCAGAINALRRLSDR
jgi:hypothetical protein